MLAFFTSINRLIAIPTNSNPYTSAFIANVPIMPIAGVNSICNSTVLWCSFHVLNSYLSY